MPILQKTLEEPLLTRQQVAVVRDIARAVQLASALKELQTVIGVVYQEDGSGLRVLPATRIQNDQTIAYLRGEVDRILMQIKTPKQHTDVIEPAPTNVPGKGAK